MLTPGKLPEQEEGKGARPSAVLAAAGSVELHPGTQVTPLQRNLPVSVPLLKQVFKQKNAKQDSYVK